MLVKYQNRKYLVFKRLLNTCKSGPMLS